MIVDTSRPSRTRGLKHNLVVVNVRSQIVASFTDAWIETPNAARAFATASVASFTDAWIETMGRCLRDSCSAVASFTDAWIETQNSLV